jgi:hypothetical protein
MHNWIPTARGQVCALFGALQDEELTLSELVDAVTDLPSEAVQVLGSVIADYLRQNPDTPGRLARAREICFCQAATSRQLS